MQAQENYELHTADCLAVLQKLEPGIVDFILTSPPYDDLRQYKGYSFQFEKIALELYRVLKPGGTLVWVVGDAVQNGSESGTSFRQALFFRDVCKFRLHDTMIYAKQNYVPLTHNRYEQQFEYMLILTKGAPKTFNGLKIPSKGVTGGSKWFEKDGSVRAKHSDTVAATEKLRPNIWFYVIGGTKNGHPAVFPEQLAEDHILSWSRVGDLVMDPFSGSGTTGKMALVNGRRFLGIEINEEYNQIARQRLAGLSTKTEVNSTQIKQVSKITLASLFPTLNSRGGE